MVIFAKEERVVVVEKERALRGRARGRRWRREDILRGLWGVDWCFGTGEDGR